MLYRLYSLFHVARWAKLRSAVQPFIILLEPASECLLCGLIASWVMTVLFGWSPVAFFFVHVLVWFVLDYILLRVIQVSWMKHYHEYCCCIPLESASVA